MNYFERDPATFARKIFLLCLHLKIGRFRNLIILFPNIIYWTVVGNIDAVKTSDSLCI